MHNETLQPLALTTTHGQSMIQRLAVALVVIDLLFPVAILIYTRSTDQAYWAMFRSEGNFTAWWSSVQLVLIGILACVNYRARTFFAGQGVLPPDRNAWVWLLFAAGFFLFAIDERFNFHELLRDEVFRPLGLFVDSAYIIQGDVGLYLFLFIGLLFTPLLLPELGRRPLSLLLFALALVLTVPVLVIDSLRDSTLRQWPNWRFWDYPFEEVGEVWAQLLFLLAFLSLLHHWMGLWRRAAADAPVPPAP